MTEFVLGKPAKQVIVEKLVSESTKLLRYSNYTISQIAFEIGFTNEANFTNFIKKNTGKTPSEVH
jgi:AraC-like DNA-binding protein